MNCTPAARQDAKDAKHGRYYWLSVVGFAFHCFYVLAIRRCKPGSIKLP